MKLGDFFAQLSYGELQDHAIGMNGAGTIEAAHQKRIVNFINKALTRLYTRLPDNRCYVNVTLSADIHTYSLRPIHNVSNTDAGNNAPRYIQDTVADPFLGNLIKILAIRLEGETEDDPSTDLLINDRQNISSVRTMTHDTFYVNEPEDGQVFRVEMQLDHPRLTADTVNEDEEITLAPILYEALEARVAAMIYGAMKGEANMLKAQSLYADYERICQLAEKTDLLQSTSSASFNDKFSDKGFV